MGRLFLLFTLAPVLELWLLIEVGKRIGAVPTLALVVFTGAVGAWLAKREGLRTLHAFREATQKGQMPTSPLIDGFMILVGGAFLVTPGIITDVLGFSLLVPQARAVLKKWVVRWLEKRVRYQSTVYTVTDLGQVPTSDSEDDPSDSEDDPSDHVIDQTFDGPSDRRR